MSNPFNISVLSGSKSASAKLDITRSALSGIKGGFSTAVMRALNRASQSGRTNAVKAIRNEYTVKAGPLRKSFAIKKASRKNLETSLGAKGSRLPLSDYRFTPKQDTTGNKRKPVRAAILNQGLRPVGSAFVWKGMILQREGTRSTPLIKPLGPAVPFLANRDEVIDVVQSGMGETFIRRLDHEVGQILKTGLKGRNGGKIHG